VFLLNGALSYRLSLLFAPVFALYVVDLSFDTHILRTHRRPLYLLYAVELGHSRCCAFGVSV
jgi:hypothetical protein